MKILTLFLYWYKPFLKKWRDCSPYPRSLLDRIKEFVAYVRLAAVLPLILLFGNPQTVRASNLPFSIHLKGFNFDLWIGLYCINLVLKHKGRSYTWELYDDTMTHSIRKE